MLKGFSVKFFGNDSERQAGRELQMAIFSTIDAIDDHTNSVAPARRLSQHKRSRNGSVTENPEASDPEAMAASRTKHEREMLRATRKCRLCTREGRGHLFGKRGKRAASKMLSRIGPALLHGDRSANLASDVPMELARAQSVSLFAGVKRSHQLACTQWFFDVPLKDLEVLRPKEFNAVEKSMRGKQSVTLSDTRMGLNREIFMFHESRWLVDSVWRRTATLESFWVTKALGLSFRRESIYLARALGQCVNLRTISFRGTDLEQSGVCALVMALSSLQSLKELNLSYTDLGSVGALFLCTQIESGGYPALDCLDLAHSQIGNAGAVAVCRAASSHAGIARLRLDSNGIDRLGGIEIFSELSSKGNLKELTLSSNKLGSRGAVAFTEFMLCHTYGIADTCLIHVDLSNNDIGPRGGVAIAAALHKNTTMRALNLNSNDLRLVMKEYADMLLVNTTLESLDLSHNCIGNTASTVLAAGLAGNTGLRVLKLNMQAIGDKGAEALARAIVERGSGCTLVALSLGSNTIGDQGGYALAEMLATNTSLDELVLEDNRIGKSGDALGKVLSKENRTLTCLDLSENPILSSTISEYFIASNNPNLKAEVDLHNTELVASNMGSFGVQLKTNVVGKYQGVLLIVTSFLMSWLTLGFRSYIVAQDLAAGHTPEATMYILFTLISTLYIVLYMHNPKDAITGTNRMKNDLKGLLVEESEAVTIERVQDEKLLATLDDDDPRVLAANIKGSMFETKSLRKRSFKRLTLGHVYIFIINVLQLRPVHEAYKSWHFRRTTTGFGTIHIVQATFLSTPLILNSMYDLLSDPRTLGELALVSEAQHYVQNTSRVVAVIGDNQRSVVLILSLVVTFFSLASTFADLFEERALSIWMHERGYGTWAGYVGSGFLFLFHFMHGFSRVLSLSMGFVQYGPILAVALFIIAVMARVGLHVMTQSSRHAFFPVMAVLIAGAQWDTVFACRLSLFFELCENALTVGIQWLPLDMVLPVVELYPIVVLSPGWLTLHAFIGPLSLTLLVSLSFAVSLILYALVIEPLKKGDMKKTDFLGKKTQKRRYRFEVGFAEEET